MIIILLYMGIIMLSREEAIRKIFEKHGSDALYITSTGYISRAVFSLFPDNDVFYMQGSMGLAPAIGLGLALNSSNEVVVISGDAALLMHLGITHTIRDCELNNLWIYVLDNNCHESVGGYPCSPLQDFQIGVDDIYRITKDGKAPRIPLSWLEIKEKFKRKIISKE